MRPVDALWQAIISANVSSRAFRPGVVVEHLPREIREALQRLTSDDSLNLRADHLGISANYKKP